MLSLHDDIVKVITMVKIWKWVTNKTCQQAVNAGSMWIHSAVQNHQQQLLT